MFSNYLVACSRGNGSTVFSSASPSANDKTATRQLTLPILTADDPSVIPPYLRLSSSSTKNNNNETSSTPTTISLDSFTAAAAASTNHSDNRFITEDTSMNSVAVTDFIIKEDGDEGEMNRRQRNPYRRRRRTPDFGGQRSSILLLPNNNGSSCSGGNSKSNGQERSAALPVDSNSAAFFLAALSSSAAAAAGSNVLMTNSSSSSSSSSNTSSDSCSSSTGAGPGVVGMMMLGSQQANHAQYSLSFVDEKEVAAAAAEQQQIMVSSVLNQLEQLIVSDEWTSQGGGGGSGKKDLSASSNPDQPAADSEDPAAAGVTKRKKVNLPKLNELGRSVVTCYSLRAYIDLLGPQHRQNIATWLYSNTNSALSSLFKYPNVLTNFHDDEMRGGVLEMVKLAIRSAYPSFATRGYAAFFDDDDDDDDNEDGEGGGGSGGGGGAPVVYLSPAVHYDFKQYLAVESGISEVVTLPKMKSTLSNVEGRLDHAEFEKILTADKQAGKRPLLVVAVVGSALFGQNDLVSRLLELREKFGFWLHVVGHGLAALTLKDPPEQLVKVLQSVDSMTVPLGQWLGVQGVNSLTLYRTPSESNNNNNKKDGSSPPTTTAAVRPLTYPQKLESLPWWVVTQHMSLAKMTDVLTNAYKMSRLALAGLAKNSQISILGVSSPSDFHSRVENGTLLPPTVLVFKYNSPLLITTNDNGEYTEDKEYLDSLNAWLAQGLIGECPQMGIHLAEFGGEHGTALRYCPLESAATSTTQEQHIQIFAKHLEETLTIVDASVRARIQLKNLVADNPALIQVNVQKWAGVGGVCYVPSMVRENLAAISGYSEQLDLEKHGKTIQQISHLNIELVHSLRASDSAFSIGEDKNGMCCVKFGMLADENDLQDLIRMVEERGKQIEESAQYLDSLAEMIRQGIEAANEDLKKENEEKLMQEGVMRQVPVVGSFLNWWSPIPKENTNIKGRSFDLKTGRIASTDVIYKHKLQMMGNGGEYPLTPTTPIETPMLPHQTTTAKEANGIEEEQEEGAEASASENAADDKTAVAAQ